MKKGLWILTGVGILIDQVSKKIAVTHLSLFEPKLYLNGLLNLQLVYNYGAAYGILQYQRSVLTLIAVLVVVLSLVFYSKICTTKYSCWGLHFILIGAIGNLIDRVSKGYVVDFIDIKLFPVFNIADVCIDIGIAFFLMELVLAYKDKKRTHGQS